MVAVLMQTPTVLLADWKVASVHVRRVVSSAMATMIISVCAICPVEYGVGELARNRCQPDCGIVFVCCRSMHAQSI